MLSAAPRISFPLLTLQRSPAPTASASRPLRASSRASGLSTAASSAAPRTTARTASCSSPSGPTSASAPCGTRSSTRTATATCGPRASRRTTSSACSTTPAWGTSPTARAGGTRGRSGRMCSAAVRNSGWASRAFCITSRSMLLSMRALVPCRVMWRVSCTRPARRRASVSFPVPLVLYPQPLRGPFTSINRN